MEKSNRIKRVETLILQSLAEVFLRGKQIDFLLIENPINFTKVLVTPDLKIANCYFLPNVRSKITIESYMGALEKSKFSIRKQVTEAIKLKYSPEIRFFYDKSVENAIDVDIALKKLQK